MAEQWPKEVTTFETSDRALHRTREAAELLQRRIDAAARANAMLESGASLGLALRENGFLRADELPELDEVTSATKLIISHWQCSDRPGYSPLRVDASGRVWCFGDAGSWSGPWGSWADASNVARYWATTKERTAKEGNRG